MGLKSFGGPPPGSSVQAKDMRTGIWLPSDWGQFWQPKLKTAPASKPVLAIVGDSIARGLYSSSLSTKGWAGLLAANLHATYGDGGSGFFPVSSWPTFNSSYTGYADILTASAGWSVFTGSGQYDGPGSTLIQSTNASGSNQTLTFTVRGDSVSVYYLLVSGGASFSWTVDGNSQGTVSTNGTTGTIAKISSAGNGAGTHTVVITVLAGAGTIYVYGVSGENAAGVVVNNFAASGITSGEVLATSAAGHASSAAALWSGGPSYPADLVIYALGVNDAHNGVTASTYLANVRSFLSGVRDSGAPKNGQTDLLVVLPHIGTYDNATPEYYLYAQQLRGLCEAYGAGLVDIWSIYQNSYARAAASSYWGDDTNDGLAGSGAVHPGDVGHSLTYGVVQPIVATTAAA